MTQTERFKRESMRASLWCGKPYSMNLQLLPAKKKEGIFIEFSISLHNVKYLIVTSYQQLYAIPSLIFETTVQARALEKHVRDRHDNYKTIHKGLEAIYKVKRHKYAVAVANGKVALKSGREQTPLYAASNLAKLALPSLPKTKMGSVA